jgi:uncharacterized protein YchJ
MDANFQRVPSINSFTLLMNDTNFTTVVFLKFYPRSFAVSRMMDEDWIFEIKENYELVRKTIKPESVIQMMPKGTCNALCACGSGKKYKSCCL